MVDNSHNPAYLLHYGNMTVIAARDPAEFFFISFMQFLAAYYG